MGPLVLVVDDDARTARTLGRMLREDGYEVEVAVDGPAAIARLTRSPVPNILISDLRMATVDGVAVVRYAQSRRPDMRVVVVTGYPHLVQSALDPPPIVLTKPLVYGDLRAALGSAGLA
ncbi:MAG TPA: response regulator [Polyangiaceae bacterium]|jgi:two-component system nitrogen regulation response regulator GlnG